MIVLDDDLTSLTVAVWESFLDLHAEPAPGAPVSGRVYTSCVNISGGWDGSVLLVIPAGLATAVAASMFGMQPTDLSEAEITDAVGELANIVGGNVKGLIEEPCGLSLPTVTVGTDYQVTVPGSELERDVALVSEGHAFHVSVYRRLT